MNKNKQDIKIAMVILAAGESTRMGSPKQLFPWKNTTLLGNTIEQGLASNVDSVFVVLGAYSKAISEKINKYNITILDNKNWTLGMGSSIACAMDYIERNNLYFDAVLIALSDQPLIDLKYYNQLNNSFINNNKNIIASQLKSRVGVPAIFGNNYIKRLSKLNKDIGARTIIATNIDDVYVVNLGDLNPDIDTEDDYKTLYNKYGKYEEYNDN